MKEMVFQVIVRSDLTRGEVSDLIAETTGVEVISVTFINET
jgi:hypothetical protein